jgi:hypothetical protein
MTDQTTQFAGNMSHIALMHRPYGPRVHMDENAATAPAEAQVEAPANESDEISLTDARQMLNAYLKKQPAEGADDATADESPVEGDDAPDDDQATVETEEADPAQKPPLELPRSWAKEQLEHWNALPRASQEFVIAQASKDSEAVRAAQNKAADAAKAAEAKAAAAEEVRQRYEAKLPEVMQGLTDHNNREYADIKSQADLDTLIRAMNQLATTDPVQAQQINAYLTGWQLHQQKMAATKAELDQSNQRKASKEQTDWAEFISTNNAKAAERIPELADKDKSQALTNKAGDLLRSIGFTEDDLNGFQRGEKISPYDHRMQSLIFEAIKSQDIKQAGATLAAKAAPKTLPPVVRPGIARQAGDADSDNIKSLENKLNETGSEKDAWALYQAKQRVQSRRRVS